MKRLYQVIIKDMPDEDDNRYRLTLHKLFYAKDLSYSRYGDTSIATKKIKDIIGKRNYNSLLSGNRQFILRLDFVKIMKSFRRKR